MSDKIANDKRIRYLDIAKGVSLLLVMISHSCGMPFGDKYFTAFYIPIFFILSGLTYKRREKIITNIYKRFIGIIVPYFMYNFLIVGINTALGKLKTTDELLKAIIGILYSRYCFYPLGYPRDNTFFLEVGNSPTWFLTAMFVSSCIFYILVECINERKQYLYIYSAGLFMTTAVLNCLPILLPWSLDTAFLGAFFMLTGYYGKNVFMQRIKWKMLIFVLAVYMICCYFNGGVNLSIRRYGSHGVYSIIIVCMIGVTGGMLCICVSRLLDFMPIVGNIFEYIGKNTIMLLALHVTIFTIFDSILEYFSVSENVNGVIYYGIGLIRLIFTVGVCFNILCAKRKLIEKRLMH